MSEMEPPPNPASEITESRETEAHGQKDLAEGGNAGYAEELNGGIPVDDPSSAEDAEPQGSPSPEPSIGRRLPDASSDSPNDEPSSGEKPHHRLEVVVPEDGDTMQEEDGAMKENEEVSEAQSDGGPNSQKSSPLPATTLFSKRLTSSDSNGAGRVVIPKASAEEHFPRIGSTHGIRLTFLDTFGEQHPLQLRFWENKSSKIYLLEGTSAIQRRYQLSKGDTLVFLRSGDGQLHISGHKGGHTVPQSVTAVRVAKSKSAPAVPESRKRRKLSKPMQSPLATIDVQYQVDLRVLQDVREDGVFREVRSSEQNLQPGIRKNAHNRWIAVLDLGGTKYKAFFPNEEEASQAFSSAGAKMRAAENGEQN